MDRNILKGLDRIAVSETYEGKPILYLQEALRFLGHEETDAFLSGISGEAFFFTYVDAPIDEPQRDHWPVDIFGLAAKPLGFAVSWITDEPIGSVKAIVKEQIDGGRPLLTHSLDRSLYCGFQLIVGYDYVKDVFILQVADRYDDQALVEKPIPDQWTGAVPGPLFWRANPLGILSPDRTAAESDRKQTVLNAFSRAAEIWGMRSFPFGEMTGDIASVGGSGGVDLLTEAAPISAAAYDAIERDLTNADPIRFKMLWRLDAQLNKLWYNRRDAGRFLDEVAPLFHAAEREDVKEAATIFKENATLAKDLAEQFWNHGFYGDEPKTAEEYVESIAGSNALITGLPGSAPGLPMPNTWRILESPWGKAVIVDTPKRRQYTVSLIHRLKENEERGFRLLESITAR